MDHADWERAAAVYLPLTAAIIARLLNGRQPRQFAACLLSFLWTVPSLLIVQRFNEYAGWWDFAAGSAVVFRGMPLELFLRMGSSVGAYSAVGLAAPWHCLERCRNGRRGLYLDADVQPGNISEAPLADWRGCRCRAWC